MSSGHDDVVGAPVLSRQLLKERLLSSARREKTERIYEIMGRVIEISKREEIPTSLAADHMAEERLASVRGVRQIFRGQR